MITSFIVSDSSTTEKLSDYMKKLSITLKGFGNSLSGCLGEILSARPDIIYVDLSLLKYNEAEFNLLKHYSYFVALSDITEEAYQAFEFHAFDYLVKPIEYSRFLKSIEKFQAITTRSSLIFHQRQPIIQDAFYVKVDNKGLKEVLIKYTDLIFIEAMQNYVILHTENSKRYLSHNTMKEMEENLPKNLFIRIHKSFIINDNKITSIEGNKVCLNNNEKWTIQLGETYKNAFLERKNRKIISAHKQSK